MLAYRRRLRHDRQTMGVTELIGLGASISLLAGWRLYLCVLATGIAMRVGWIDAPANLPALDVLANPWVIGIAAVGTAAEFFADKLAWLDSLWDGVHTLIRPIGGALLALAIVDAQDPAWQVASLLLGGGAALASHGAKAGARALVNTSPEPFSNIVLSVGEDVATAGLLTLVVTHPMAAGVVALLLFAAVVGLLLLVRRMLRRLFRPRATAKAYDPPSTSPPPSAT